MIKNASEKKKALQRRCESVNLDRKSHSRQISLLIEKKSRRESISGIYEVSENDTWEESGSDIDDMNELQGDLDEIDFLNLKLREMYELGETTKSLFD